MSYRLMLGGCMLLTTVLFGWWFFGDTEKQVNEVQTAEFDHESYLLDNGLLPQIPRIALPNEGKQLVMRRVAAGNGTAQNFENKSVNDFILQKKPLLIHFWATWCGPCKAEMPAFAKAVKQMPDFNVVCIAIQDTFEKVVNFYTSKSIDSLDFTFDNTGIMQNQFGITSVPMTILIDDQGRYAGRIAGVFSWENGDQVSQKAITALKKYLITATPAQAPAA